MIFEVYRQDERDNEIVNKTVKRYHTEDEDLAFFFMENMNLKEDKIVWRVAKSVSHYIIFDLDDNDFENLKKVKSAYEKTFGYSFRIIKSFSGYHLISGKRYEDNLEWQYDTCRALYPELERKDLQKYIEAIQKFVKEENEKQQVFGLERQEFLDSIAENLKDSGLWCGTGIFDIYFCLSVIQRGKYSLRISKKGVKDEPREVFIEELEQSIKN